MPYTRNQKRLLGISDLTAYSIATSSTPLGKEQTSGDTQFDIGFFKQLKELITQIIQEERSARPSPPRTPPAAHHHNQNHSLPHMKLNFPKWDEDDPSGWVLRAYQFFHFHGMPEASRVDIASIHPS
jgi:hypothetical protein